ncbi:unnamed protein product [Triticum turgidum subsp. durum]|uniref:MORF/ORRM1/DAG-like MORF domain-containing protein n=1 Tax=Triticum turgidum subsp. durum TaxID=4567 RepID=A0A9R0ZD62_TRITD|nr:unnamed protein product [Triticum turgidum subsp. durum]
MAMASRAVLLSRLSPLPAATSRFLLRPLAAAASLLPAATSPVQAAARGAVRCFATQPATSSLRDSSPNWSNRPPKETILLDGCDFEHWLVVIEPPAGDAANPDITRDEIIDSYIKTLAQVVGSEQEARQKIYSVSTRHYFAFGALVSEELSYKLKELPKVRWVLPDSYLDVRNKDYGGEPFIGGEAVPYDPKYHEEWVRNNARANERSRRSDRPRNFDRSRNFERRTENMQNFQNRDAPPGQQGFNGPPPSQNPGSMPPPPPPSQNRGNVPPPYTPGGPSNYQPQMQNPQAAYTPGGAPQMPNPQTGYAPGGAPQMPNPQTGYAPGRPPHMPNQQAGYVPSGASNYQQGGQAGYQGGPAGHQGGNQVYPRGNLPGGPGPAHPGSSPGYQGANAPLVKVMAILAATTAVHQVAIISSKAKDEAT